MCTEENLIDILDDLPDDNFNTFVWHLKKETWNGIQPIKSSRLQKADRMDVVDLMVQTYQMDGAAQVMMNMLKKINRNDLVKKLADLCPAAAAQAASSSSQADPVEVLLSVRTKLVGKISKQVLQQILDKLLENKIMNDCELEFDVQTQGEKVRAVVDMVRKKGPKASSAFIAALCELDPCLAEDLKLK
ncbi:caspase b [Poeciliopsis prolifica]|uniref:caspase b n=1 Tax=Poeciliopsis prolifica TaxID=188132 RepID=UPI0024144C17|nr:caspase b [Poeciliopsis prolifica]